MGKQHILASAGVTDYAVIVDFTASTAEQFAARELKHYLERVTGAAFRVTQPQFIDGALPIIVGFNKLSAMFEIPRDETLGDEDFLIRSVDRGIIIAGGGERGTLYGVYAFLETLGCRFLAADETVIPHCPELCIEPLDIRETPAFLYRYGFYRPALAPDWAVKARFNGTPAGALHGGYLRYHQGAQHSFDTLVPADEYFDTHPEYFSEIDGIRRKDKQLCLTNPDVYRIILDALRDKLKDDPENNIVSVSISDRDGPCQCAACKKIDDAAEAHSGSLVLLLNKLAEALLKDFPDVVVGTLAYLHERKPPKGIIPRKNVCIWLCSIECCYAHPLDKCVDVYGPRAGLRSFPDDLQGWAEITELLFVWDYVNNFAHFTQHHPNFQVLQPNLQFLRGAGVCGVFEQGHTESTGGSPALNELRFYLLSKLLWNPDCDIEAHKRDFLEGYYGAAANDVTDFIVVFEKRLACGDIHFGISAPPNDDFLDKDTLDKAQRTLDSAAFKVKGIKKLEERLKRLQLLLDYPRLSLKVADGSASRDEIHSFFNEVTRLGYDRIEEGMPLWDRRRYVLEMGRVNNLVGDHFREKAFDNKK